MISPYPIPTPFGPVNMRDSQTELGKKNPGALVDILNFDFYEEGLKTRDGFSAYSYLFSSNPVLSPYVFKKDDGTKTLIAACGSTLYKDSNGTAGATAWAASTPYTAGMVRRPTVSNGRIYVCTVGGTSGTVEPTWPITAGSTVTDGGVTWRLAGSSFFSSLKTGITSGNLWDFSTIVNLLIGVDGVLADAFKFDGTTAYALAITAPATEPTASSGGSGVLSGNYQYKVTFVSKWGAETNPGPASTTFSASNNAIALSNIPVGASDIAKRKIYRTKAGGTIFYLLDTINDNTTTTYSDNTSDLNLGTDEAPIDNDTPPNGEIMAVWKEYLFMVDPAKPTRGYHSHQSYPEIFNTDEIEGFYVNVGLNDGEFIIGIRPVGSALYWFKENSTWPMTGDLPDDFKVAPQPINGSIGLYHRSIDELPDGRIIGLHRSGIYLFDGYNYSKLTDRPQDSIQKMIDNLNPNRLKYAVGKFDTKKKRYLLAVSESGYSYNNKLIVWDEVKDKLTIYDISANGFVEWNDQIVFASSKSDGYLHKMDGNTNDDGAAISVRAEFPWWSLWDPETLKLVKYLLVETTQQGTYQPTMDLYINARIKTIGVWLEETKLWGSGAWVLEGGNYRIKKLLKVNRKGVHYLKAVFRHSGLNQPVTLNTMTVLGDVSDRVAA